MGSSPIFHPTKKRLDKSSRFLNNLILGRRQAVRHSTLTAACVGSNPAAPAKNPECVSNRDFYFLPLHYSLYPQKRINLAKTKSQARQNHKKA